MGEVEVIVDGGDIGEPPADPLYWLASLLFRLKLLGVPRREKDAGEESPEAADAK